MLHKDFSKTVVHRLLYLFLDKLRSDEKKIVDEVRLLFTLCPSFLEKLLCLAESLKLFDISTHFSITGKR